MIAVTHRNDSSPPAAVSSTGVAPPTSAPPASSSAAPSSSSSTTQAPVGEEEVEACSAALESAPTLVKAASSSASHWKTHTEAETKLEEGTVTRDEAQSMWDRSKPFGPSDVAAFKNAYGDWEKARSGCDGIVDATADGPMAAAGKKCESRFAAAQKVADTGKVVNDQWAAHVEMMKHKDHTDMTKYVERWLGMVHDSKPALSAYSKAHTAWEKAPACTTA